MNSETPDYRPKVSLERRVAAFAIDLTLVALISSLLTTSPWPRTLLFIILWLGMRVVWVSKNQGQSLGRWALDMRVIDLRLNRTPGLYELIKREGFLALCAALTVAGLAGLTSRNASVLILMLPLVLDICVALVDQERHPQAFHDRLAHTIIIGSRRGYSLDIKLRYLLDTLERNMRR